ncbi:helix-turn-helix domain-containing protein [Streptosporangium sp. NPDC023615]|uniref:TetR/AcrR family transcriptional regulator n=1 Tax=Streptosporangium sp. NPDC023615 TaxID=3154794 RepID=UPI003425031B
MTSIPHRAPPLPPDERRAALIASTLSLVLAHGPDVSTRQIARAAGVAEGTIFRVFATKDELVNAAVSSAFDPAPLLAELRAVDGAAPLEDRLIAAVEIMQRHTRRIFGLMNALGAAGAAEAERTHRQRMEHAELTHRAIADLIVPDRDRLRCEPGGAAQRLKLLTIASGHPAFDEKDPMSPADIVSLLLDGIRRRPDPGPRP